jgi:hypothetical protein
LVPKHCSNSHCLCWPCFSFNVSSVFFLTFCPKLLFEPSFDTKLCWLVVPTRHTSKAIKYVKKTQENKGRNCSISFCRKMSRTSEQKTREEEGKFFVFNFFFFFFYFIFFTFIYLGFLLLFFFFSFLFFFFFFSVLFQYKTNIAFATQASRTLHGHTTFTHFHLPLNQGLKKKKKK